MSSLKGISVVGTPFHPNQYKFTPEWKQKTAEKRLHGAFTGGWVAGYNNSVGSKEGWTPATFKSTSSKGTMGIDWRHQTLKEERSKLEYFQDDDDLEEAFNAKNSNLQVLKTPATIGRQLAKILLKGYEGNVQKKPSSSKLSFSHQQGRIRPESRKRYKSNLGIGAGISDDDEDEVLDQEGNLKSNRLPTANALTPSTVCDNEYSENGTPSDISGFFSYSTNVFDIAARRRTVINLPPSFKIAKRNVKEKDSKTLSHLVPAKSKNSTSPLNALEAKRALEGFMPYTEQLSKHQKYLKFLTWKSDAHLKPRPHFLTTLEINEFTKSARMYAPLSDQLASRFIAQSAGGVEGNSLEQSEILANNNQLIQTTNFVAKKSDHRKIEEWKPSETLCDLLQIPPPIRPNMPNTAGAFRTETKPCLDQETLQKILNESNYKIDLAPTDSEKSKDDDRLGWVLPDYPSQEYYRSIFDVHPESSKEQTTAHSSTNKLSKVFSKRKRGFTLSNQ